MLVAAKIGHNRFFVWDNDKDYGSFELKNGEIKGPDVEADKIDKIIGAINTCVSIINRSESD